MADVTYTNPFLAAVNNLTGTNLNASEQRNVSERSKGSSQISPLASVDPSGAAWYAAAGGNPVNPKERSRFVKPNNTSGPIKTTGFGVYNKDGDRDRKAQTMYLAQAYGGYAPVNYAWSDPTVSPFSTDENKQYNMFNNFGAGSSGMMSNENSLKGLKNNYTMAQGNEPMKEKNIDDKGRYDINGDGTTTDAEKNIAVGMLNSYYAGTPYAENGNRFRLGSDGMIEYYNDALGWSALDPNMYDPTTGGLRLTLNGEDTYGNIGARNQAQYLLFKGYDPYVYGGSEYGDGNGDSWDRYMFDQREGARDWWADAMDENSAIGSMFEDLRNSDVINSYDGENFIDRYEKWNAAEGRDLANMDALGFRTLLGDDYTDVTGFTKYAADAGIPLTLVDQTTAQDPELRNRITELYGPDAFANVDEQGRTGLAPRDESDIDFYNRMALQALIGSGGLSRQLSESDIEKFLAGGDPEFASVVAGEANPEDWADSTSYALENYYNPFALYDWNSMDVETLKPYLDEEIIKGLIANNVVNQNGSGLYMQ